MVGTGSPVSFRRRPPLTFGAALIVSLPRPQNPHVGTRVPWGPARHDNHEGQRMTPGAPTDGARSRFPGHRGSTEAGTTLKDSGKRRRSSKGVHCGSPLIDEAGADNGDHLTFAGRRRHSCELRRSAHCGHIAPTNRHAEGPAGSCLRAPPPRVNGTQCRPEIMCRPVCSGLVTLPPSRPRPRRSTHWTQR